MNGKNSWLILLALVSLLQGCATNSLLKLQQADLTQRGVVTGCLSTRGPSGHWRLFPVYLKNLKTKERFNLNWNQRYFFSEVPAGKYALYLGSMVSPGYGYRSQSTVKLQRESLPFWVEAGEVVYVGDMLISFHKTSGPDYSDVSTWIGFMVGFSSSKVKISYAVGDNFGQSKTFVKGGRPDGGYRHTKKIISFGSSEATATDQEVENAELFIDTGVAESVEVSKLRYEVNGKKKEFEKKRDKLVWYALPSQKTRQVIDGKELDVELVAPDNNVIQQKKARVVNELGLILAEFDLSAVPEARRIEGRWFTRVLVGESTSKVQFEFND